MRGDKIKQKVIIIKNKKIICQHNNASNWPEWGKLVEINNTSSPFHIVLESDKSKLTLNLH